MSGLKQGRQLEERSQEESGFSIQQEGQSRAERMRRLAEEKDGAAAERAGIT